MDISCKAQDPLAMKKKKEDIEFLKNKPLIEEDLQDIADQMGIGKVDLGTTKNSSTKFSDAPVGLDLNDPDHEEVFSQLFYSLQVEKAFEKVLKQFGNIKNIDMIRRLLVRDHFYYGVAVPQAFTSTMTGLPDLRYIHPGRVYTPLSNLPDHSDDTHRIIDDEMTVMEMFNFFGNEIGGEEDLEMIINGKGNSSYCGCGKNGTTSTVDAKNWGTFKVNFKYVEVKSVDWVGVKQKDKSKRGVYEFTDNEKEATNKIWGQNTYGFWWLLNTKYCFGIHRLDYSHRTKGKEAFQNFSTFIYRSQPKSAVELCIGENKIAQVAYVKLQHAIIKSLPQGKYIDLRFLRSALDGLKDEETPYTLQDLINLAFEHNILLGDTEGFDGKNDGQIKPFVEIPGGLRAEVQGYWTTILNARANVAYITGINQQLTGQSPEELIGLQQLQINTGLNAINYCNIALQSQLEGLNNNWASLTQSAIEAGGATRKAIVDFIGIDDTDLLDSLDEAPLHNLTIKINFGDRYKQMQAYETQFNFLKSQGAISSVDEYLLNAIDNPKEKFQKLYFVEDRWKKEQAKIRQETFANAQAIEEKKGQNAVQETQVKGQEEIKKVYAAGDVNSKLMQLGSQLGLGTQQMDAIIKRALQQDRKNGQQQEKLTVLREKSNLEQQKSFA